MNITAQLDRLNTAEKFRAMEYLWDDLCRLRTTCLSRHGMARRWQNASGRQLEKTQHFTIGKLKKPESATCRNEAAHP